MTFLSHMYIHVCHFIDSFFSSFHYYGLYIFRAQGFGTGGLSPLSQCDKTERCIQETPRTLRRWLSALTTLTKVARIQFIQYNGHWPSLRGQAKLEPPGRVYGSAPISPDYLDFFVPTPEEPRALVHLGLLQMPIGQIYLSVKSWINADHAIAHLLN